jgi:hypothetical protein
VGRGLGAVLSDGGIVHLFHGDQFVPAVLPAVLPSQTGVTPLALGPRLDMPCARAQAPLPRCNELRARAIDDIGESLVGRRVRVRGVLSHGPVPAVWPGPFDWSLSVLGNNDGKYLQVALAGGRVISCSDFGPACCDIAASEREVIVTATVRLPDHYAGSVRLADATLCEVK